VGVLSSAQKHVNCFDQGYKCFARHFAEADSDLFSLNLKQENCRKLLCESKTKLDVKNKQALSTTHKQCSMVMLPYKKFETDFFCW